MSILRRLTSTFVRDSVQTDVKLDTATSANNRPFPVDLYDTNGQRGTSSFPFVVKDENSLNKNNGVFDAFYRQRFSQPQTIFDSKQLYDTQPYSWSDAQLSGAGTSTTYNTNEASTTIAVGNLTAGKRGRQSYRWFAYQTGKGQLIVMTGIWGAAATGIKRKAGLFNDNNGLFFDQTASGMGVTVRTYTSGAAVDTRIAQADWNIDTMDGNGDSGITLDFTKTLIWFLDFQWLGVGTIRFGWFIGGRPYYCHAINNSNVNTLVYMSTPNLPLRYEIENDATGAASEFTHICTSVISEGGMHDLGYPFAVTRSTSPLTTNNDASVYPLIALRLKSGYFGASIRIIDFSIVCSSTSIFNYYIIRNPTVTGTALSWTGVTNSAIEVDVSRTNATTITGQTLLVGTDNQSGSTSGRTDILKSDFYIGSDISGTSDIIVLAVQRLTGATETFYASINWKEQV